MVTVFAARALTQYVGAPVTIGSKATSGNTCPSSADDNSRLCVMVTEVEVPSPTSVATTSLNLTVDVGVVGGA